MKPSGILTLFVVLMVLAYIIGERMGERPATVAARDTMRIIEVRRDTVLVEIKVREKARQHWDTIVRNVSDTQVVIQRDSIADTVRVPVEVIQRDRSKDSLLSVLYLDRGLDSLWHIQDAKLPHKPPPRWSLGLAAGYACTGKGCGPGLAVGVTWRP